MELKKSRITLADLDISFIDDLRSQDSITFIYSIEDDKLYSIKYPSLHKELIRKYKLHDDPNDGHMKLRSSEKYVFGRIGKNENDDSIIGFYGDIRSVDYGSFIGDEPIDKKYAEKAIKKIIEQYPNFDYENMYVALMSATKDEVYYLDGVSSGNLNQTKEDDPDCQRIGVPVDGQEMSIRQILANLHMVRGDQIEKIRHGFCPLSQKLNQQTSDKCPSLNKAINYISKDLKCGQENYQKILKQGRQGYRQQLKNIFGNPDAMDSEFRTQKDMDKAWDFYRKAESVMGFEQWMKLKEDR